MKNKRLSDRLKAYSISAGAITASSLAANAAVIYTNPNDETYTGGDSINLDINSDGILDIALFANSSSSTYNGTLYVGGAVFANPLNGAALAGSTYTAYTYPYALNQGDTINAQLQFQGAGIQTLNYSYSFGTSNVYYGNWLTATDKYIGLRLEINGATHFGWIRLDAGPGTFTVKDWAFDDQENQSIEAGSSITLGVNQENELDNIKSSMQIWNNSNQLNIQLDTDELIGSRIEIMNVNGQLVHQDIIRNQNMSMNLDVNSGVYFLRILKADQVMTHRFVID